MNGDEFATYLATHLVGIDTDAIMVPAQMFEVAKHPPWFCALHHAILQDVVRVLAKGPKISKVRHRVPQPDDFNDTLTWIATVDHDHPFSFNTMCEVLEMNPDRLRRGLARVMAIPQRPQRRRALFAVAWTVTRPKRPGGPPPRINGNPVV